jgi:uncharacterized delta-60 repeat protein
MKNPIRNIVVAIVASCAACSIFATSVPPGNVDPSFDPGSGPNGDIYCVAAQADGRVLIGGNFTYVDGESRNRIARLGADGSLDDTFNPGIGANDFVICMIPLSDGKVLMGGIFTVVNGTTRRQIARLNPDGSLDTTFNPGQGTGGEILSMALQPDGKVLVAGTFNSVYRLNSDGTFDSTFNSGSGANSVIYCTALLPDGKLLIGGAFSSVNGSPRSRMARLNADGSLDDAFFPGTGPEAAVLCMVLQPDGKPVIGGNFTRYNGKSRNRVARLNADGSEDASFYPAGGANSSVVALALEAGGKVLIGGDFISFNGTLRNRIARLTATGVLDAGFDPGTGADATVRAISVLPDNRVLIAGSFTSVNNIPRSHVARLLNDAPPLLAITLSGPNVVLSWPTNLSGFILQYASGLNPPVAWINSAISPALVGSQYTVTNPASANAQLYRLKK